MFSEIFFFLILYLKHFSNKNDNYNPLPKLFLRTLVTLLNENDTNLRFRALTLPPFTVSRLKFRIYLSFGVQNDLPFSFKYYPRQDHARADSINEFLYETPVFLYVITMF